MLNIFMQLGKDLDWIVLIKGLKGGKEVDYLMVVWYFQ